MNSADFTTVFQKATGLPAPYAYQCRLAGGADADPNGSFTHGTTCQSPLIEIPTGL